jgi:hypothetical protein
MSRTTFPAGAVQIIDLAESGDLVDPSSGGPVSVGGIPGFLERRLSIPPDATDIVVFVHGWRNSAERAFTSANRLVALVESVVHTRPQAYSGLSPWRAYYVLVRWPSMSNPLLGGYRRIRNRSHAMTTNGRAPEVLAYLLGYLNQHRRAPAGPNVLRSAGGQYLHCVGHSFGGRFLVEALQVAALTEPRVLGRSTGRPDYPWTADCLLVFQMAAPPDVFGGHFAPILSTAPVGGPIVLTHSSADRAVGTWHRHAERAPGIGSVGASTPVGSIRNIALRRVDSAYERAEFDRPIVNVDASWRYRRGRFTRLEGAHSDIWHSESAHLLLSLAHFAR